MIPNTLIQLVDTTQEWDVLKAAVKPGAGDIAVRSDDAGVNEMVNAFIKAGYLDLRLTAPDGRRMVRITQTGREYVLGHLKAVIGHQEARINDALERARNP